MKVYNYPGTDLSFSYPDSWTIEQEKNIISIYNPTNGVGALQFSFYQVPNPQIISLKDELEDYIRDKHNSFEVIVKENYAFSNYLDDNDGRCWKYWLFLKNKTLAFASYNCQTNEIGKESKYIDEIIGSGIK